MSNDPLDVQSLPSDPREMALRLLGMTVSELKQIDERVISGHQSVGGVKLDVNKVYNEVVQMPVSPVTNNGRAAIAEPTATLTPQEISINTVVEENIQPVQIPVPSSVISEDDMQLEFNFYRKIKPEDLEYQLKQINTSLQDISSKLEQLLSKKKSPKINANQNQ